MARPKQFDVDEAMQEALEAFWDHGYSATSVQDLLEEMGLNRGSLYGTFGDKKQLFLAVLEKYYEQRVEDFRRQLNEPPSAKKAITGLLEIVAAECIGDKCQRGCLAAKVRRWSLQRHDKDVADWLKRFPSLQTSRSWPRQSSEASCGRGNSRASSIRHRLRGSCSTILPACDCSEQLRRARRKFDRLLRQSCERWTRLEEVMTTR